jgi:hypothetical protein
MKYAAIASMCKPQGGVRGCPFDGLGCPYGNRCSINSDDDEVARRAWNAESYGDDFHCVKREHRVAALAQPKEIR